MPRLNSIGLDRSKPRRRGRRIRRLASALTPALVLTLLLVLPAGAGAGLKGNIFGCSLLVDAAHSWQSRVAGGNVETGDHWLTDRQGTHSTCAFTHRAIHRLLALPPRTYRGRDGGHLLGGSCSWTHGSRHEIIRPFQSITCILPMRLRQGTINTTVEAFVDPDPRFIR